MLQSLSRSDTSRWLILKHLLEQVKTAIADLVFSNVVTHRCSRMLSPLKRAERLVLTDARPDSLVWCPENPKNLFDLQQFILPLEERLSESQLGEDTTAGPDVYRCRILIELKE